MDEQQTVMHLDGEQPTVKRRLGRGLNALLGNDREETSHAPQPAIRLHSPEQDEISVELLERNPFQPRREFEQEAIDELAESIRKHGVLQPLLVRAIGDRYQLIAGERRWRAAQQVGLETIPCRVVELEDRQVCEAAIEENLKRQDLNVVEKAQAFKEYLETFGGTIEDLARQLSMNRSTISNMLRLLELPEVVQDAVRQDRISGGHARALLPLSADAQIELARQIEQKQLSVRKTEEAVRSILKSGGTGDASAIAGHTAAPPELTPHVISLQDYLREQFAARIEIKLKKQDAGQIVIHFGSNDDFERIIGRLRNAG
ncbi:MAG: ParB/RepB/Spo0J family partition protein [Planctomycetaceae bacterium]|nr:ParB/RepB/Spo0J family partition protein [Planctomycetaceae bacterium]